MKICWLVPDDYWGGVFPVSLEVCRQARLAGDDARLLMVCEPAHAAPAGTDVPIDSLHLAPDAPNAPAAILNWLAQRDFDAVVLNCCGEADPIPPYLPESIRCIYVVHNSPRKYWIPAVRHERHIDLIVAISDFVADIVRPHLNSPERLVMIHNGSAYPPIPPGRRERPEDLLFLGGDEPRKGAVDLLKVWSALAPLGFKGRLHWCGTLSDDFNGKISALPAREQIVIHGRVPRDQVFQLAGQCQVLLMLSRVEAFGMVTIEAMSMGCLPVAWDVKSGTREIVQPGRHGFFAPLGNSRLLARAVMDACANHASLAPGVIERARGTFSVQRMWADHQKNLSETLKGPGRERPLAGGVPPSFSAPRRPSSLLPVWLKGALKQSVQRNPRLASWLNQYWGM